MPSAHGTTQEESGGNTRLGWPLMECSTAGAPLTRPCSRRASHDRESGAIFLARPSAWTQRCETPCSSFSRSATVTVMETLSETGKRVRGSSVRDLRSGSRSPSSAVSTHGDPNQNQQGVGRLLVACAQFHLWFSHLFSSFPQSFFVRLSLLISVLFVL
jgi:hypothetical protein